MHNHHFRVLKRVLLRYVTTIHRVMKQSNSATYYDTPAYLFIFELRQLLGPWNGRLPSSLALTRAGRRAQRLSETSDDPLEAALWQGLQYACETVAVTATPEQASARLLKMHGQLIKELALYWRDNDRLRELCTKLDQDIIQVPTGASA
jgi:hypothetical protein